MAAYVRAGLDDDDAEFASTSARVRPSPGFLFRIRSGGAATLGCIFLESFRVHLVHKSDVVFNQTVILKHFTPTYATFVIVTLTDCHRGLR